MTVVSSFAEHFDRSVDSPLERPFVDDYRREKISFCVVFGSSGQLVAVEDLIRHPSAKRAQKIVVPQIRDGSNGSVANFLWHRTTFALGIGKNVRTAPGYYISNEAFRCFRALHIVALEGVTDTSLQAFLRFLTWWTPDQFLQVPAFRDRIGLNLVFRFQYDDEFLHERHAARLAWKRISTALRATPVAQQPQVLASLCASGPQPLRDYPIT